MSVQPLPPLVASYEVRQFISDLDRAADEGGFILLLNPVSDVSSPHFDAAELERRLIVLMRLSAQATYWSGGRVAKIVDLGDRWSATDRLSGYLRSAAVANHLKALSRSGFASLERIGEWASDGPPTTQAFRESIRLIQRALRMMHAVQLPVSQRIVEFDLWFEHKTTPFRVESSQGFLEPPESFLNTGHLIEVEPPAFAWGSEESSLLNRSRSPIAVSVASETEHFAEKVTQTVSGKARHVVFKAKTLTIAEHCLRIAREREGIRTSLLIQIDDQADPSRVADELLEARASGTGSVGIEMLVRDAELLAPIADTTSRTLALVYGQRE